MILTTPLIFKKSKSGRNTYKVFSEFCKTRDLDSYIPSHLIRTKKPSLPEVTEFEVVRHYTNLSIKNHFLFTAVTANSICKFLNYYINENINIKWPNDININESKIAGIMTEIVIQNIKKYLIIGMGINITNSPKINDYKTCCLKEFNSEL